MSDRFDEAERVKTLRILCMKSCGRRLNMVIHSRGTIKSGDRQGELWEDFQSHKSKKDKSRD
jgi:hypothetical protein